VVWADRGLYAYMAPLATFMTDFSVSHTLAFCMKSCTHEVYGTFPHCSVRHYRRRRRAALHLYDGFVKNERNKRIRTLPPSLTINVDVLSSLLLPSLFIRSFYHGTDRSRELIGSREISDQRQRLVRNSTSIFNPPLSRHHFTQSSACKPARPLGALI
jgi:hypothetical protein